MRASPSRRNGILVGALVLATMLLAACGGGSSPDSTQSAADAPLVGTQWVLQGTAVTSWLRFTASQASGSDGCNQFRTSYQRSGAGLSFGPLAGTRKACPGEEGEVAAKVNALLPRVATYAISGTTLRLSGQDGAVLLTYRATTASVEGAWEAVSVLYDDGIHSVIIGTTLTASFKADGKVSGSGGCNSFSGTYTAGDGTVKTGSLVSTQRACAGPEGANEQETGYFAALESARTFEQVGDTLTLLNAKGQRAVDFTRSGG